MAESTSLGEEWKLCVGLDGDLGGWQPDQTSLTVAVVTFSSANPELRVPMIRQVGALEQNPKLIASGPHVFMDDDV